MKIDVSFDFATLPLTSHVSSAFRYRYQEERDRYELQDGSVVDISMIEYDNIDLGEEGETGELVKAELRQKIDYFIEKCEKKQILSYVLPESATEYVLSVSCYPVYSDEEYLVVRCQGYCYVPGLLHGYDIQEWYVTIDKSVGKQVKLEDYFGDDISEDTLRRIGLAEYEKLIEWMPEKYSPEVYKEYYDRLFEWDTTSVSYGENRLEEYYHYFFTKEGLVLVFGSPDDYGANPGITGVRRIPSALTEGEAYEIGYMELLIPYDQLP